MRKSLDLTLVPERTARDLGILAPGERYALTPAEIETAGELKRELSFIVSQIAGQQVGDQVDRQWIDDTLRALGEAALGVVDWSMAHEQVPEALEAVVLLTTKQLAADLREAKSMIDDDIPF